MRQAVWLTVMTVVLACCVHSARTEGMAAANDGPNAGPEPSIPSKVKFSVGKPETVISFERMKEADVRGIDGSLYALNDKGQWKWFGTNLVKIVYSTGPRDNPLDHIVAKSELQDLPDTYTDTRFGFAVDHRWGDGPTLANVYLNPKNGHILGFFHTEWTLQTKGGAYFRFGLGISKDGGKTFQWCGHILATHLSYETWLKHWRGVKKGGPFAWSNVGLANYVVKDGYFYLYYTDTEDHPATLVQGTAVARAKVEDVLAAAENLQAASWKKYHQGQWNEGGISGKFTPLNIKPLGFLHGDSAYNSHLDRFVLVTRLGKYDDTPPEAPSKSSSILLSFSKDGIHWSDWQVMHEDNHLHDYPSIVSMGDDNEVVGKSFWVYYKYCFSNSRRSGSFAWSSAYGGWWRVFGTAVFGNGGDLATIGEAHGHARTEVRGRLRTPSPFLRGESPRKTSKISRRGMFAARSSPARALGGR